MEMIASDALKWWPFWISLDKQISFSLSKIIFIFMCYFYVLLTLLDALECENPWIAWIMK